MARCRKELLQSAARLQCLPRNPELSKDPYLVVSLTDGNYLFVAGCHFQQDEIPHVGPISLAFERGPDGSYDPSQVVLKEQAPRVPMLAPLSNHVSTVRS